MATSSFFYGGTTAPEQNPNQVVEVSESSEDTVKTSFFYGGSSGPDQNSVSELLADLLAKLDEANALSQAAAEAAAQAANSANLSSSKAADSQTSSTIALQAQYAAEAALSASQAAQAATQAAQLAAVSAVNQATLLIQEAEAIISSFTISTSNPSGGEEGDVWFKVSF